MFVCCFVSFFLSLLFLPPSLPPSLLLPLSLPFSLPQSGTEEERNTNPKGKEEVGEGKERAGRITYFCNYPTAWCKCGLHQILCYTKVQAWDNIWVDFSNSLGKMLYETNSLVSGSICSVTVTPITQHFHILGDR